MKEFINDEDYTKEEKNHKDYFNHVVGVVTFSISLACLSFKNPQVVAWLSFPIILSLLCNAPNFSSLDKMRGLIRFAATKDDRKLLIDMMKEKTREKSKIKAFFDHFIYFYGLGFYIAVAARPDFTNYLKSIQW